MMILFEEDSVYDKLRRKIKNLDQYAWKGMVSERNLEDWLQNFVHSDDPTSCERLQMLHLIGQFMYFGGAEIRELIQALFRDKFKYKIVREIRKSNNDTLDAALIGAEFERHLLQTRFLGMGNPSESGTHLLYYFRQENSLPKSNFINAHEVVKRKNGKTILRESTVDRYVFIDDLCGSGEQAKSYSEDVVRQIKELDPNISVVYYVLFGTTAGIEKVRNETLFDDVDCIFELDSSFKCFGDDSRHYKDTVSPIDKTYSKSISLKYGQKLFPSDPLGYEDCELLLGLYHNTPDNTLPIIWCNEPTISSWVPIFKRYNKVYD